MFPFDKVKIDQASPRHDPTPMLSPHPLGDRPRPGPGMPVVAAGGYRRAARGLRAEGATGPGFGSSGPARSEFRGRGMARTEVQKRPQEGGLPRPRCPSTDFRVNPDEVTSDACAGNLAIDRIPAKPGPWGTPLPSCPDVPSFRRDYGYGRLCIPAQGGRTFPPPARPCHGHPVLDALLLLLGNSKLQVFLSEDRRVPLPSLARLRWRRAPPLARAVPPSVPERPSRLFRPGRCPDLEKPSPKPRPLLTPYRAPALHASCRFSPT